MSQLSTLTSLFTVHSSFSQLNSSLSPSPLTSSSSWSASDLTLDLTLLALYSLTAFTSILGNSAVVYVSFWLRAKSTTSQLIGNMALSDLLSGLLIPIKWIVCSAYFLEKGEVICGLAKTLQMVTYYISTFSMALIAYDRYRILRNPLSTRIKPKRAILFIWSVSLTLNLPTLVSLRVPEYFSHVRLVSCRTVHLLPYNLSPQTIRLVHQSRILFMMVTMYLLPLAFASALYCLSIRRLLRRGAIGEVTNGQELRRTRSRVRTIQMLVLSLAVFAIAFAPIHLQNLLWFTTRRSTISGHTRAPPKASCDASGVQHLFYWLALTSNSFNPLIYCSFDGQFRRVVKSLVTCSSDTQSLRRSFSHSHSCPITQKQIDYV